jgi:hypothetical protein
VPQVEVAVRLGWKARNYDTRAAGLDVRRYDAADEIAGARARFSPRRSVEAPSAASSLEFVGRVHAEAVHLERPLQRHHGAFYRLQERYRGQGRNRKVDAKLKR